MESHVNRSATLRRLNGRTREGRKDAPRGGRRRACLARLAVTAAGGADLIAAARRSVRAAGEGLGAVLQGHGGADGAEGATVRRWLRLQRLGLSRDARPAPRRRALVVVTRGEPGRELAGTVDHTRLTGIIRSPDSPSCRQPSGPAVTLRLGAHLVD